MQPTNRKGKSYFYSWQTGSMCLWPCIIHGKFQIDDSWNQIDSKKRGKSKKKISKIIVIEFRYCFVTVVNCHVERVIFDWIYCLRLSHFASDSKWKHLCHVKRSFICHRWAVVCDDCAIISSRRWFDDSPRNWHIFISSSQAKKKPTKIKCFNISWVCFRDS